MLIPITVANRGPENAEIPLLPTLWFRNTWAWGYLAQRPQMHAVNEGCIEINEPTYARRWLSIEGTPELLFTENDDNSVRLYGVEGTTPYVKDSINNYVVHGARDKVNPERKGTKAAAYHRMNVAAGRSISVRLRFSNEFVTDPFKEFQHIWEQRRAEADEFYAAVTPASLSGDARSVMRQAFAGLFWSKQFYHYVVREWLHGDPAYPPPPPERLYGRNHEWKHLYNADVISMPDKWEYPWYAAWDLAFHCFPIALVDSDYPKEQLILMLRRWYMHP